MQLKTTIMVAALLASGGTAMAGDCPHEYKPPKHKVPPRKPPKVPPKAPPVTPPTPPPCACKGEQGPPGPKGDDGHYIIQVVQVEHRTYVAGLTPRLGVMGFISSAPQHADHGDWGWGAALQLDFQLTERTHLTLDGGLAAPFNIDGSPGRQSGYLLHVGLTRFSKRIPALGITGGIHFAAFDGDSTNGNVDARYLGLDVGVVARKDLGPINLRAELTPVIGGLRDTYSKDDTQFSLGLAGSLFIGVNL